MGTPVDMPAPSGLLLHTLVLPAIVSKLLNGVARPECHVAGTKLFTQGMPATATFYIESGLVKLSASAQLGREFIVELRNAGRMIGLASALTGQPYPMTATLLTNCNVRRVDAGTLLRLTNSDNEICRRLLLLQSYEVLRNHDGFTQLACASAEERLKRLLWEILLELGLASSDKPARLNLPLRNWEIAQLLVVSPAYLSRMLKRMEKQELLVRKKGWLIIPDPQKLLPAV